MTEYSFRLLTNGAVLKDNLLYYDGKEAARLGDITVFDSGGQVDLGTIKSETVREGYEYLVTVCVDDAFMKAAVYPVYIDPSISITTSGSGSNKTIQDAPVYSNNNNANGGNEYNLCGFCGASIGYGRVLYKLPGLTGRSDYQSIAATQINSVTLHLREGSGKSGTATVKSYPFKESWGETVVTKNNVNVSNYETSSTYSSAQTFSSSPNWWTFDLTQTVKAWKNGSFGSGAYGVILKNNNETDSAYYRNFLATEYSNASYRPYITFTYTPKITISASIDTIVEGSNLYLTATTSPTGLTVTWSSSNPTIATVSGGTVTGIKAGYVRIRATCTVAGVSYYTERDLYVRIANGVYYIKNNYSNLYMHVQNGGTTYNTNVYLYSKYADTSPYKYRQLWKVTYISNGYYSLRPLHLLTVSVNQDYGAGVYDSYTGNNLIALKSAGSDDLYDDVYKNAHWSFEYDLSLTSYRLRSQLQIDSLDMYATASGTALGSSIIQSEYVSNFTQSWSLTLTSITPEPNSILISNTITFFEGVQVSMADYLTSAPSDAADMRTTWYSDNTNIISINSSTGIATPKASGTCIIRAYNKATGVTYSRTVYVFDSKNVYFLRNGWTGWSGGSTRYADVFSFGMTDTSPVYHWSKTTQSNQMWKFESQPNGYFKIYPMHTDDKVLALGSLDASTGYYKIVINDSSSTNDNVYWTIEHIGSGRYAITSKTGSTRVLSVNNYSTGTELIAREYNGAISYWYFDVYENDAYWDNAYDSYTHPYNVYYYIDTSGTWNTNILPLSSAISSVSKWNGISSKVNLVYHDSTLSNLITVEDWPSFLSGAYEEYFRYTLALTFPSMITTPLSWYNKVVTSYPNIV